METYNQSEIVQNALQPSEDEFTKTIEKYTASIPPSAYLAVAVGAMRFSLVCQLVGRGKWGKFHRAVGSNLADHWSLQQGCKTRGP